MVLNDNTVKSKLTRRWIGPAQIVAADAKAPEHVFTVEYLGRSKQKKREVVHVRRLKLFEIGDLAKTSELAQHAEMTVAKKWTFSDIIDLRKGKKGLEVKVVWTDEGYDPSWQPLAVIAKDAPKAVYDFLVSGVPESSKRFLVEAKRLAYIRRLLQKEGSVTAT